MGPFFHERSAVSSRGRGCHSESTTVYLFLSGATQCQRSGPWCVHLWQWHQDAQARYSGPGNLIHSV